MAFPTQDIITQTISSPDWFYLLMVWAIIFLIIYIVFKLIRRVILGKK